MVQIIDPTSGAILKQYPRKTKELLLIDQDCYEPGSAAADTPSEAPRPLPLGRMARRLEEIASEGVATRSIDFYAQIAQAQSAADRPT